MRIVYNDEKLSSLSNIIAEFFSGFCVKSVVKYSNGMERVNSTLLRNTIDAYINGWSMSIGSDVTHAYGIGNNCRYPVYSKELYHPDELTHIGYININHGMFGEAYVYLDDYNGKRVGCDYEITDRGIRRS